MTWVAVLIWAWCGFASNYPPSESYAVDAVTGQLSDPTRYESLSEIPFPVGWPLRYVTPSYLFTPPPVILAATPPPPPAPSRVFLSVLVVNVLLIVLAIAALVYLLQRFMFQFSLLTLFILMSAFPIYLALGKLVGIAAGYELMRWYPVAVYFSPIAAVLVVRYSIHQRLMKTFNYRLISWRADRASSSDQPSLGGYDNPHDALAAASSLDRGGDWNAAIELYRHTAERWPEHSEYVQQCVEQIAEKQSLAQT